MPKRSKLYRAQLERFDKLKRYSLAEAAALLKELPSVKFDQTVEIAFKLGVDPKQTDQTVRGAVALPRGTGKEVRVVVIADDDKFRQEAEAAGANVVGFEDVISKIKGGWLDFDVLIATPSSMSQIRPLGPPSPRRSATPSARRRPAVRNSVPTAEPACRFPSESSRSRLTPSSRTPLRSSRLSSKRNRPPRRVSTSSRSRSVRP